MTGDIYGGNIFDGNISELSRCTKLTNLAIQRNPNLTGTVENFVSMMVTAGRTSGTIETDMRYTGITFNSKYIQDYTNDYLYFNFNSTGATVENANHTLLGTYANSTWVYA